MNPGIDNRMKDFGDEMASWTRAARGAAREHVATAQAEAPGNLASTIEVDRRKKAHFNVGNLGHMARGSAIFTAKTTLAVGAVAGAVYIVGSVINDGSRSIGSVSNRQVIEAQARKEAVTVNATPALRSPGGHTMAELIHAGYVRPGADPSPQDWSQVQFTGKNGVHAVGNLSDPKVTEHLEATRQDAMVGAVELDLALYGAKLKDRGFSPADYLVVAQLSDLSAAREWLQDGADPAGLEPLVGAGMADTMIARLPMDQQGARQVILAERRDPLSFLEEARRAARGVPEKTYEDKGREQEKSLDGPGLGFD